MTRTRIKDFTQGSITRQLAVFAAPLFLSNLLQIVYNMVDMIVVGNVLGQVGLSAVSVGGDLTSFMTFLGMGFCAAGREAELEGAVRQAFTPEFLGRIDRIVAFRQLGEGAMEAIAWKYLRQLQERASAMGIQLQLPEEVAVFLGERCRGKGGARSLRRKVQMEVEGPLASFLLQCSRKPGKIKARLEEGEIRFSA